MVQPSSFIIVCVSVALGVYMVVGATEVEVGSSVSDGLCFKYQKGVYGSDIVETIFEK